MNEKKLYQQKMQAQLDEWKADLEKLRARASGTSADLQLDIDRHIKVLDGKVEEGKIRLAEVAEASEDAWEAIKDGAESSWDSMKSAFSDAAARFKK